jgi:hypothetical protein
MIRLFEVTEVVDLSAGRKNVHCHWFVILRKRPLFGPNGSLQPDYLGVVAAGAHDQDCEFVAEEFFTADEAKAFAELARTRLHIRVKIEPAKLPISNDSKSFQVLLAERGYHDVLLLDDGAGNELDFAVGCYDEDAQEEVTEHMRAGGKLS